MRDQSRIERKADAAQPFITATSSGEKLLAHELTHVVQQGGAPAGLLAKMEVSQPDDPAEVEAERVADRVMSELAAPAATGAVSRSVIEREAVPEEEEELQM